MNTNPRSGQPIVIPGAPSSGSDAMAVLAGQSASGYGKPIPIVFGTAKVAGQVVFYDASGTGKTSDEFKIYDASGKMGDGTYAPVIYVFAQGPISAFRYWWRDGSYIGYDAARLGTAVVLQTDASNIHWSNVQQLCLGDGSETVWSYIANIASANTPLPKTQDFWIGTNGLYAWPSSPNASYTDGGVSFRRKVVGDEEWFAKVGSNPQGFQYIYNGGQWTFSTADNGHKVTIHYTIVPSQNPAYANPVAYKGLAQYRCQGFAIPSTSGLPTVEAELSGFRVDAASPSGLDANPANVAIDLLTDPRFGIGLSTSQVEVDYGPDGNTSSGYRTYCTAMRFYVSRAIDTQVDARELLKQLMTCTNSRLVQTGNKVKIIPLGDVAVTGNGQTYTPASVAKNIGLGDFVVSTPGEDPVKVTRKSQDQVFNVYPVTFRARYNSGLEIPQAGSDPQDPNLPGSFYGSYQQMTVEVAVTDETSSVLRRASPTDLSWVTNAVYAAKISQLLAQRALYVRNEYQFKLNPVWCDLEPGDLVSLTEPVLGLNGQMARVTSIEEQEDSSFDVWAEEWNIGTGHAVDFTPQQATGFINSQVSTGANGYSGSLSNYAVQAVNAINDMANDNKLTPAEKTSVVAQYAILWNQKSTLDAQADGFGVSRTAYDNALTTLQSYMVSLGLANLTDTSIAAWQLTTTIIDGPTFRNTFNAASGQTSALTQSIQAASKAAADAANAAAAAAASAASSAQTTANAALPNTTSAIQTALAQNGGLVTATQLANQAVTAGKLNAAFGSGNMLSNSSFEAGVTSSWGPYYPSWAGAVATISSGAGRNGGTSAKVTMSTAASSSGFIGVAGGAAPSWLANQWYTLAWYARTDTGNAAIGGTGGINWNNQPDSTVAVQNPTLSTAWQRYVFRFRWTTGTIDAGHNVWIQHFVNTVGAFVYIDDVQLTEGEVAVAYSPKADEILPGTITAPMIQAGTITADRLNVSDINANGNLQVKAANVTGTLTAGQIGAGAIGTTALAAGAVTTKTMAVADLENLCTNPNGEVNGADGWTASMTVQTAASVNATGPNGAWGSQQMCLGWTWRDITCGPRFAVTPGDTYFVSYTVYNAAAAGNTLLGLWFKDGSGGGDSWLGIAGPVGAGWRTVTGVVAVPAGAATAQVWGSNSGNTGSTYIRDVQVRRQNGGNLIVDGTITANKLNVADINATGTLQVKAANVTGSLTVGQVSGLGSLATKSSVADSDITGVSSGKVSGLGPLATGTNVNPYVTSIDGGAITTGIINANRINAINVQAGNITVGGTNFALAWFSNVGVACGHIQIYNGAVLTNSPYTVMFNAAAPYFSGGTVLEFAVLNLSAARDWIITTSIEFCQDNGWNVKANKNGNYIDIRAYAGNSGAQNLSASNVNMMIHWTVMSLASSSGNLIL